MAAMSLLLRAAAGWGARRAARGAAAAARLPGFAGAARLPGTVGRASAAGLRDRVCQGRGDLGQRRRGALLRTGLWGAAGPPPREVRPPRPEEAGASGRSPAEGGRCVRAFLRYLGLELGAGRRQWRAAAAPPWPSGSRERLKVRVETSRGCGGISVPLGNYMSWVERGSRLAGGQTS